MDKRINLGIPLYFDNSSNSGIVNYIYNIIYALKTLPVEKQPNIVLFHSGNAPIDYIKDIDYPFITFELFQGLNLNKFGKFIGSILRKINLEKLIEKKKLKKIDVLYPYFEFMDGRFEPVKNKIHWLVDFNNRAFPQHYPVDEAKTMINFQQSLFNNNDHVVLSSNTLLEELKKYYPGFKNKISILKFACSIPDFKKVDLGELKRRFKINGDYLMSPNQFWEHKNQITLIEALRILNEKKKINFTVVFTGSMAVNRGKGHMLEKLLDLVEKYNIKDNVKFLGIIDRNEQLALMKDCISLIQPSLYEGWSTLVEEAKALNQNIVLSNLPVHREQNCVNSLYFNPFDANELAIKIEEVLSASHTKKVIDYSENIRQYGRDFAEMIKPYKSKN